MHPNATEDVLAKRFRVARAPTLVSRAASRAPIAFTRLHSTPQRGRSLNVPCDDAFAFQVLLSDSFFSGIWVSGKPKGPPSITRGDICLFDLKDNPTVGLGNGFDTVRIYLPQIALNELAYDRGIRRIPGLRASTFGSRDLVMFGLAQAAIASLAKPGDSSALFADYLALALHDHVIHAYGSVPVSERSRRGGLAPWQLHRAHEFINANLDGDPSIARLAEECGLSRRYFARAFKQSMGMPPHQWLIKRRVERAKELLQDPDRDLAEIALACGFVDQSHLTRAFSKREGHGPGTWRRRRGIEPTTS